MNTNYAFNQNIDSQYLKEDEKFYTNLIIENIDELDSEDYRSKIGIHLKEWRLWVNNQARFNYINFDALNEYKLSMKGKLGIDFDIAVKYWISEMCLQYSYDYIGDTYGNLKRFLEMSNAFSLSADDLATEFTILSQRVQYNRALAAEMFINYFPNVDSENDYKGVLKEVLRKNSSSKRDDSTRELPPTKEVYIFDRIVKDYFKNLSYQSEEFKIWFPIFLWWEFSVIIPLRPVEFAGLKKNALEGSILKLPREKNKKSKVQIIDRIPIPDYLRVALENYISQTEDSSTETLLHPKMGFTHDWANNAFYTNERHNFLISRFYREVVRDKYGYSMKLAATGSQLAIECKPEERHLYNITHPITTGDTRHFAILNLMRQGYNPLEIARLAGHTNLAIQVGYYSHLEYWVDVEVLKLTEEISRKFNKTSGAYIDAKYKMEHVLTKGLNELEYIELDFGICLDLEQNCPVDDCPDCPFWQINLETFENEHQKLNKLKTDSTTKIKQTIAALINLQKAFYEHKEEKDYEYSRDLKNLNKNLDFLLRKYTTYNINFNNARRR